MPIVYNQTPEVEAALRFAGEQAAGGTITAQMMWLGALTTSLGEQLLGELHVQFAAVRANCGRYADDAGPILQMASRLTHLTDPSSDCAEQLLHGLLLDRESLTAQYLDGRGVQRRHAARTLEQRMQAGEQLSFFDLDEVCAEAIREGHPSPGEGHYLRVALAPAGLAAELLVGLGVELDELTRAATSWPVKDFTPSCRVNVGRIEAFHLLLALARSEPIKVLMRSVGIVGPRLESTTEALRFDYPQAQDFSRPELPYVKPACEEAQRLGAPVVGAEHLVLGLLADPRNAACRALRRAGVDLTDLRRRLEEAGSGPGAAVKEMEFSAEVVEALARATHAWGGKDADSAYVLLQCSQVLGAEQQAVESVLPSVIEGSLDPGRPLVMAGVRLGQKSAEVIAAKGEPLFRQPTQAPYESWTYLDCGLIVDRETGLVRWLNARELFQDGRAVLKKGDSWVRAEEVLGVRRRSPLVKEPPGGVMALVSRGAVQLLAVSDITAGEQPGEARLP